MAENVYFRRVCSEIGLESHVDSSVQVIPTGVKEFNLCVQTSFLKKRNVIYLFPWFGPCSIIPNGCPFYRDIIHASPFRVPEKLLTNQTFHNLQECISIHIRLVDRKTTCESTSNYSVAGDMVKHCTTTVNSVPEKQLLDTNIFQIMYPESKSPQNKAWHNKSLREAILYMEAAALDKGKYLYILIPSLSLVYDWLRTKTPQIMSASVLFDLEKSELSDLESLHIDMAVAAGCSAFVPDHFSSASETIKIMRGGEMVKQIDLEENVAITDLRYSREQQNVFATPR